MNREVASGKGRRCQPREDSRGAMRLGVFLLLAVALLIPVIVLAPTSVLASGPHPGGAPRGSVPLAPTSEGTYPTAIRHVFVVYLENTELSTVQSGGPYEMGLAKNYTQASRYYAPCHPSAP
ncbi:MAG TPA: hypothetical protein VGX00_02255, partial [Thermoplasmata archaeon]|nr:hypothetical protein [Thermoplasmata archaeon]